MTGTGRAAKGRTAARKAPACPVVSRYDRDPFWTLSFKADNLASPESNALAEDIVSCLFFTVQHYFFSFFFRAQRTKDSRENEEKCE